VMEALLPVRQSVSANACMQHTRCGRTARADSVCVRVCVCACLFFCAIVYGWSRVGGRRASRAAAEQRVIYGGAVVCVCVRGGGTHGPLGPFQVTATQPARAWQRAQHASLVATPTVSPASLPMKSLSDSQAVSLAHVGSATIAGDDGLAARCSPCCASAGLYARRRRTTTTFCRSTRTGLPGLPSNVLGLGRYTPACRGGRAGQRWERGSGKCGMRRSCEKI